MLTKISRLLQRTLELNRYAALPFVMNGEHDGTDQWMLGLRERLLDLVNEVDRARAELNSVDSEAQSNWTDGERALFGEFLARNYPNEASAGVIALGDAWKDGLRIGSEAKAPERPASLNL